MLRVDRELREPFDRRIFVAAFVARGTGHSVVADVAWTDPLREWIACGNDVRVGAERRGFVGIPRGGRLPDDSLPLRPYPREKVFELRFVGA